MYDVHCNEIELLIDQKSGSVTIALSALSYYVSPTHVLKRFQISFCSVCHTHQFAI